MALFSCLLAIGAIQCHQTPSTTSFSTPIRTGFSADEPLKDHVDVATLQWRSVGVTASDGVVPAERNEPSAAPASPRDALEELARRDPLEFLFHCRRHYDRTITGYRCVFAKQERINGVLRPEQEMRVMFRETPFSVDMKWFRNPGAALQANYVAGRWKDESNRELAWFKPAGLIGLLAPQVKRAIHGPEALRESRKTLDQFGFKNTLNMIIEYCVRARGVEGYRLEYTGPASFEGRPTFTFRRFLPYENDGKYPDRLLTLHIDQEWLIPVVCLTYADAEGQELLGSYILRDVELNPGLTDRDFEDAINTNF